MNFFLSNIWHIYYIYVVKFPSFAYNNSTIHSLKWFNRVAYKRLTHEKKSFNF